MARDKVAGRKTIKKGRQERLTPCQRHSQDLDLYTFRSCDGPEAQPAEWAR